MGNDINCNVEEVETVEEGKKQNNASSEKCKRYFSETTLLKGIQDAVYS